VKRPPSPPAAFLRGPRRVCRVPVAGKGDSSSGIFRFPFGPNHHPFEGSPNRWFVSRRFRIFPRGGADHFLKKKEYNLDPTRKKEPPDFGVRLGDRKTKLDWAVRRHHGPPFFLAALNFWTCLILFLFPFPFDGPIRHRNSIFCDTARLGRCGQWLLNSWEKTAKSRFNFQVFPRTPCAEREPPGCYFNHFSIL